MLQCAEEQNRAVPLAAGHTCALRDPGEELFRTGMGRVGKTRDSRISSKSKLRAGTAALAARCSARRGNLLESVRSADSLYEFSVQCLGPAPARTYSAGSSPRIPRCNMRA